jgi:hypothetical protein
MEGADGVVDDRGVDGPDILAARHGDGLILVGRNRTGALLQTT